MTSDREGTETVAADLAAGEAMAILFEQHGDKIYSLGLRVCGGEAQAEDLVQETFLRALKSWELFEGRSKPSTWLYTIATRACQRMKRRRAGEPEHIESLERLLPSGDAGLVQVPSADDPQADAIRSEAVGAVLGALEQLPVEFRLPFVLKEMADFSLSEIGEVLGLKAATVKTRIHRGRLKIRQRLASELPSAEGTPHDHAREECLALLRAKLEAMDRHIEFPRSQEQLCNRCRSVFRSLDYGQDTCRMLGRAHMPDELRRSLKDKLAAT